MINEKKLATVPSFDLTRKNWLIAKWNNDCFHLVAEKRCTACFWVFWGTINLNMNSRNMNGFRLNWAYSIWMVFHHFEQQQRHHHHHLVNLPIRRDMFLFLIELEFDFHSIDSIFRLLVPLQKEADSNFVAWWPLERASDPIKDENRIWTFDNREK